MQNKNFEIENIMFALLSFLFFEVLRRIAQDVKVMDDVVHLYLGVRTQQDDRKNMTSFS